MRDFANEIRKGTRTSEGLLGGLRGVQTHTPYWKENSTSHRFTFKKFSSYFCFSTPCDESPGSCWIPLRRARLLKVVVFVEGLLLFSSWLILKQQSAWLWFGRTLWYFTLTIHRPNPLVTEDSSSINTSAWSVKPLLGYAGVKKEWSFTSSPFIRFYNMTVSKDMVFRLKNNYSFVSVATHVKVNFMLCRFNPAQLGSVPWIPNKWVNARWLSV